MVQAETDHDLQIILKAENQIQEELRRADRPVLPRTDS